MRGLCIAVAIVTLAPFAAAGSQDAPELTDAAGDARCHGGASNEYADIVAAWISDETADGFNVNLALNKWTHDALGSGVGFTVQFTHQKVQFGAVAAVFPDPESGQIVWEYGNAFVDFDTGELQNYTASSGSFTPGTPSVIQILFLKSMFPHTDAADNKLVDFIAGDADFKTAIPLWMLQEAGAPAPDPALDICDEAEDPAATYTFGTGGHSMHGAATNSSSSSSGTTSGSASATASAEANTTAESDVKPAAAPGENGVPGPGLLLALAAVATALLVRRRSA